MLGYWENPAATADAVDANGWLHSGDLGVMHEDGLINITGRKKDMIIRGGENIYPREIEEVLHEHESVAQAQVFGVPDDRLGEEVAVWLKVKQGSNLEGKQITEWLKERIAYFKVPRYVKVVEEYPMTVTGKVQKFAMREQMIKELGLETASKIETA
jgi:fatty-acyl-CoA synthase